MKIANGFFDARPEERSNASGLSPFFRTRYKIVDRLYSMGCFDLRKGTIRMRPACASRLYIRIPKSPPAGKRASRGRTRTSFDDACVATRTNWP
jgi:hypothetical protein